MATIDGLTKERMLAIEAESIVSARLDPVSSHLILTTHGGTDIDVGNVRGPQGVQGPPDLNAVDKTTATLQTMAGPLQAPSLQANLGGTLGRYVGVTSGQPTYANPQNGDFAQDVNGTSFWMYGASGWLRVGSNERTGDVKMTLASTAAVGFLMLDGSQYNVTDYPDLANLLGVGSGTFTVPDWRGRGPIGAGQGPGLTLRALGARGGEEAHALVLAENAQHNHPDSGHGHGNTGGESATHHHTPDSGGYNLAVKYTASVEGTTSTTKVTGITFSQDKTSENSGDHVHGVGTGYAQSPNSGSGVAHNNMQPWVATNFMVKT